MKLRRPSEDISQGALHRRAVGWMLVVAVLFSTGGAAVKATQLNAWQVAGMRSAIAALFLLLLLPSTRRGWTRATFLVGAFYAATLVLFVHANKLTTAASTIFLQATSPLYLMVLGPLLLHERLVRRDLILVPLLGAGMCLFFVGLDPVSATAPDPLRGNLLALLSGACYACTILGLRALGRGDHGGDIATSARAVVCGNVLAAIACAPGAWPVHTLGAFDLLTVAYLGVFQIAVAYVLMLRALRHLSALEAGLLLLLEPTLSPLWATLFHREIPGAWSWVGGAIILSATVVNVLTSNRRGRSG